MTGPIPLPQKTNCFALVLDAFSWGKFEDLFLHYLF